MKEGRREAAMFLIIYLTSRAAVWIRWSCLLLVFIRRSEITLFFPPRDIIFHHGLFLHGIRLLATVHANQKLWFMHLSCGGLNIKFNFAAVEPCLPRAEAWHGELGLPELRRIHYFLHNMRKQHLNETFVSCQNRVASTLSIQIRESVEEGEKVLILDCNKAVSHVMVAH